MIGRSILSAWSFALITCNVLASPTSASAALQSHIPGTPEVQSTADRDTYLVRLAEPSLAAALGGSGGAAAVDRGTARPGRLNADSPESRAYLAHQAGKRAGFLEAAEMALGRPLAAGHVYDVVFGGLTLELTPSEAGALAQLPGVRSVTRDDRRELLTDRGPIWIGASASWGSESACVEGGCGEGVIVGVIDTGINFDHPSFADIGGDGYDHTNPLGSGVYKGWCNPGYPVRVTCNDKLIGAWSYANSGDDPEDPNGHGSHTASTAAGNRLDDVLLDAPTISQALDISGVAPHANIIAYDACVASGCDVSDLIAAINQAVKDGVDVLNYSIGGSWSISPWLELESLALLDARIAGVFVAAAAGNDGPGEMTIGALAGAPWVTTVAASTHDRSFANAIVEMATVAGGGMDDIVGRGLTAAYGPAQIVYAGDFGNALCAAGIWPSDQFAGEIVVCDRGVNARLEKGENVLAAGGGAMILANAASDGDDRIADAHVLPAVHIGYDDGVALKAWLANGLTGHRGRIAGASFSLLRNDGDVMASFSSRGPGRGELNVMKPDITAPGVSVVAAVATGADSPPAEIDLNSGTSMAAPHVTGAAALMVKAHPDWTPAEIQSALMTTAALDVRSEDGVVLAGPFARGSGRVDVGAALNAGLVLDVTGDEYEAADPLAGGDPRTLNLASMVDAACYRNCGWTRTVRNPTDRDASWSGVFRGENGLRAVLTPTHFDLPAGATRSFALAVEDNSNLRPGQWYFGEVTFTEAAGQVPAARFPVAVRVAASTDTATVAVAVSPVGATLGGRVTYSVTISNTDWLERSFSLSNPVPEHASYVPASATGGLTFDSGANTLRWSGNLGSLFQTNRTKQFTFQVESTCEADCELFDEATVTVLSQVNRAWASASSCGAAAATPVRIALDARGFASLDWSAWGEPCRTYELWRSTAPYFSVESGDGVSAYAGRSFSFIDGEAPRMTGDVGFSRFYRLRTLNCTATSSADSGPVGRFGFSLTPGEPASP